MSEALENFKSHIIEYITPTNSEMAGYTDDQINKLLSFLALSVGRVWYNDVKRNPERVPSIDLNSITDRDISIMQSEEHTVKYLVNIPHITDWLKASIVNNEPWVSNLDSSGRPKKLMKFSSINQIVEEADKAMRIANQKLKNVSVNSDDEELFMTLNDDYYMVRMKTSTALDRESSFMQHCIGNGGYDNSVQDEDNFYLSVRDMAGKPHITIEMKKFINEDTGEDEYYIYQVQGKQNKPPLNKYMKNLSLFLSEIKPNLNSYALRKLPYVIDKDMLFYHYHDLPKIFEGSTFIVQDIDNEPGENNNKTITLPKEIYVNGILSVSHMPVAVVNNCPEKIVQIFDNIDVNDKTTPLSFWGLKFKTMPKYIEINSNHPQAANFTHCVLSKDLETIKSLNNLNISSCHNIPPNIEVANNLTLNNVLDEEITANIKVGGDLDIFSHVVKKLPDNLTVPGTLSISSCLKLSELPSDLNVGTLNIIGTEITSLPTDINVKHMIKLDKHQILELDIMNHDGISDDVIFVVPNELNANKNMTITAGEHRANILSHSPKF